MINRAKATWRFFRDPRGSLFVKLLFLASVAYIVFPADVIPDLIPVLGWLDDLGVAAMASAFLWSAVSPYLDGSRHPQLPYDQPVYQHNVWRQPAPKAQSGGYPSHGWGHHKPRSYSRDLVETDGVELS